MKLENVNQMKRIAFYTLVGILSLSAAGCQDLAVENNNAPDRTVAFAQPGDVVNLVKGTFADYWLSIQNCSNGALFFSTLAD